MKQITFVIAIVSLALALAIFIGNLLTHGLRGEPFSMKRASSKWMVGLFGLYVVSFLGFIVIKNDLVHIGLILL